MSRSLTFSALLATAAVSFGLYQLAYEVQKLEEELKVYNQALLQEREAIHVLHAEWSYLTRPEALQDRALRNLQLQPLLPEQIAGLADLPPGAPPGSPDLVSEVVPMPKPRGRPAAPAAPALPAGPALAAAPPKPRSVAPELAAMPVSARLAWESGDSRDPLLARVREAQQ